MRDEQQSLISDKDVHRFAEEIHTKEQNLKKWIRMYHHERDVRIDVHTIFTFKIFFQKNRNKPDSGKGH